MSYTERMAEAQRKFAEAKAILEKPEVTNEELDRAQMLFEQAKSDEVAALKMQEIMAYALSAKKSAPINIQRPNGYKEMDSVEFMKAVWRASRGLGVDERLMAFSEDGQKDLSGGVGATAGYLIPTEFDAQLRAVMAEDTIVRSRATIIRMSRRQVGIPVLSQSGKASGRSNFFGAMECFWQEENTDKTESDPNFRELTLVAHELTCLMHASDAMIQDSAISLSDYLSGPLGMAGNVAWTEDFEFLQGNGVKKPLGVINSGATVAVPRAADNAIAYADVCGMLAAFLPSGRGVWVANITALSQIMNLKDDAGNVIWVANARDGVPQMMLGRPIIWTEKLPTLGTTGDLILADFRYYIIGDRQATTIESSNAPRWVRNQTSWRAIHRVDGQPMLSDPITLADGVTEISPFVMLTDKIPA